ncbi:MAG: MFS transporter [Treponema sp.]|nr:MFS transporter [Treponema sp.]
MEKKYTLGHRRTLGYASGIITESLIYNMYFTYYLVFLTSVAGLKPALAGTVSLISVFLDALADPVLGFLSDRPGADKRRFMARALFPLALSSVAAFVTFPAEISGGIKFIYYVLITIVFWLSYTTYTIPYYAVVAEITEDYDERTRIRSLSSLINTGGICLGNVLPAILPGAFAALGFSFSGGWLPTVAVLAFISLVFGVITLRSLRQAKLYRPPEQTNRFDFFKTMLSILKLAPFKGFSIFVFFYLAASAMIQANIVFMIVHCVGLTQDFMAAVVGILVVTMLIFIPVTTAIAEKRDRRAACLVMFSLMLAGLVILKIVGIDSVITLVFEAVTMGIGTAAFWTVFYSISYDLVEVDELINGARREGTITAVPQFIQKFGAAVGVWLAGIFLTFYKYDSLSSLQSEATVKGIESIGTIIPAVFLAFSIAGLLLYPVTRKRFEKLLAALAKKRLGEAYTTEGFEKLVS